MMLRVLAACEYRMRRAVNGMRPSARFGAVDVTAVFTVLFAAVTRRRLKTHALAISTATTPMPPEVIP